MPTFYDRFVECAERWPNNVALELQRHDHIESCTYAELRRMAESVGRWITENGFARGSRLAIVADNHPRWVAAYLGIIAAGCTVVPLDTALHADQLAKLLKDSGSSALFCDAKHAQASREAVAGLNVGLVLMDPDRMAPARRIHEHLAGKSASDFRRRARKIPARAFRRGRPRFPALHLGNHRRPQGRDADPRQSAGRSGGSVQLGGHRAGRRACWASCPCFTCWRRWRT